MKTYRKIATIVPIAVLSTSVLFAPTMSFAAEKNKQTKVVGTALQTKANSTDTTSQTNEIKGYVVSQGITTPIYKNSTNPNQLKMLEVGPASPGFPELSENPLVGVPQSGKSVTETGNMGDIIYFDKKMDSNTVYENSEAGKLPNGQIGKIYIQKTKDKGIELGYYDPDTFELYPVSTGIENVSVFKTMPEAMKQFYQKLANVFDGTTKLKRETQYSLLKSSILDNAGSYKFSEAVKHGLTTTNFFSFAATAGFKISAKIGGGVLPGEITSEFSESLTATYSHTIAVSDEKTVTQEFSVGKVDNSSYKYDKYVGAAYQLNSTYSVIPGTGLTQLQQAYPDFKLAKSVYTYNDEQMYFAITPGSHISTP